MALTLRSLSAVAAWDCFIKNGNRCICRQRFGKSWNLKGSQTQQTPWPKSMGRISKLRTKPNFPALMPMR